jgi:hypothetical protein
LSGLILIIFVCIGFPSEAANKPAPEELNSFTFYYSNGTKINFDEVRNELINCIYPKKQSRNEYETKQEFEERQRKCPCIEGNVTSLKDIYFMIPVASMKYDADNFKFIIVAGAGYKMFTSKTRIEPVHILERKHDNTKLHEEIEAFIGANPSDRTDYVSRFAESPYIYKRTYVDSFTREYFTNAILDTRHDGIGSGNEVIYSIRFEADSPIEMARRLKTMKNDLVFMIRGDMIFENSKGISDLTRIKNVFYINKIALFNLETGEAIISATP